MWDLIEKINQAVSKIEEERAAFDIKCLVSRRTDYVLWDLVLTAPWIESNNRDQLRYLTERILSDLDVDLLTQFSAIIPYPSGTKNHLTEILSRIQRNAQEGKYPIAWGDLAMVETRSEIAPIVVPLVNITQMHRT